MLEGGYDVEALPQLVGAVLAADCKLPSVDVTEPTFEQDVVGLARGAGRHGLLGRLVQAMQDARAGTRA